MFTVDNGFNFDARLNIRFKAGIVVAIANVAPNPRKTTEADMISIFEEAYLGNQKGVEKLNG